MNKYNTCKYCGKEFKTEDNRRKYCNEECRKERNREYDRLRKRKERKNMSEEQKTVLAKKKSDRAKKRRKENKQSRVCRVCKVEFIPNHNGTRTFYCSEECFKEERRKRNRERWRKNNTPKPDVTINCEWCGKEHTVPARTAHQARFCSDKCRQRARDRANGHIPWEKWKTRVAKQKQERLAKLKKERAIRTLRNSLIRVIKYKEEQERIKELTRECEECGTMFYDPHPLKLTCSSECSRKRSNRLSRYYERKRINKYNLVDKDISLKRLYKRDKGICYLCGEPCDYNDKIITDEGYFIAGETYPSIDHVIPIAKGGKHSWENVKLAHHKCNAIKSDRIIRENKTLV